MRRSLFFGLGGVVAAFLGALCCLGPLIFLTVGVGAGLAAAFEPLRPVFGGVMAAALAMGFYSAYGPRAKPAGESRALSGGTCYATDRRRDRAIFWTGLVLALILWTFPSWSVWLA